MESSGGSTAIMFAVAAVLWFAYLIPTWFRRREYLATERNATRLQQTLRIMAETAEVPQHVRVEASARGAAHQAKMLREQERLREERERAQITRVKSTRDPALAGAALARRRVRRSRLVTALLLLASLATGAVQLGLVATTGATTAAWVVLGAAALTSAVSLGTLRRLASRRIPAPVLAARRVETPVVIRSTAPEIVAEAQTPTWTPVPVPKPLYLSKPTPQRLQPTVDAEQLMREASAAAERALRAAHAEPEVLAFPARAGTASVGVAAASAPTASSAPGTSASATGSSPSASPTPPSRWAGMGIVDPVTAATPDLDEVLRRRRAAG